MVRWLLGLVGFLACGSVALAEPPSGQRVMAKAGVPPQVQCVFTTSQKMANAVLLPLPNLGFVPLPVEVWRCTVDYPPPNAPAGAPRVRAIVHLFTLAE